MGGDRGEGAGLLPHYYTKLLCSSGTHAFPVFCTCLLLCLLCTMLLFVLVHIFRVVCVLPAVGERSHDCHLLRDRCRRSPGGMSLLFVVRSCCRPEHSSSGRFHCCEEQYKNMLIFVGVWVVAKLWSDDQGCRIYNDLFFMSCNGNGLDWREREGGRGGGDRGNGCSLILRLSR